jgi:hypothetical protein
MAHGDIRHGEPHRLETQIVHRDDAVWREQRQIAFEVAQHAGSGMVSVDVEIVDLDAGGAEQDRSVR